MVFGHRSTICLLRERRNKSKFELKFEFIMSRNIPVFSAFSAFRCARVTLERLNPFWAKSLPTDPAPSACPQTGRYTPWCGPDGTHCAGPSSPLSAQLPLLSTPRTSYRIFHFTSERQSLRQFGVCKNYQPPSDLDRVATDTGMCPIRRGSICIGASSRPPTNGRHLSSSLAVYR